MTNISSGGVFIRSKHPLPVGTLVNLSFTLFLDDIEVLAGVGEVVRLSAEPGNPGMGVVFRQLTSESRDVIERLAKDLGWTDLSGWPDRPAGD